MDFDRAVARRWRMWRNLSLVGLLAALVLPRAMVVPGLNSLNLGWPLLSWFESPRMHDRLVWKSIEHVALLALIPSLRTGTGAALAAVVVWTAPLWVPPGVESAGWLGPVVRSRSSAVLAWCSIGPIVGVTICAAGVHLLGGGGCRRRVARFLLGGGVLCCTAVFLTPVDGGLVVARMFSPFSADVCAGARNRDLCSAYPIMAGMAVSFVLLCGVLAVSRARVLFVPVRFFVRSSPVIVFVSTLRLTAVQGYLVPPHPTTTENVVSSFATAGGVWGEYAVASLAIASLVQRWVPERPELPEVF